MALYRVYLRQATDQPGVPARKWATSWFCEAPNPTTAAAALVGGWEDILRNAAYERVFAYEAYATSAAAGDSSYAIVPVPTVSQRGALPTPASAQPYLPKACVSVTLNVLNSRPSRKFWRPGLYEQTVNSGVSIDPTLENNIRTAFTDLLAALTSFLRDPDGQSLDSVGPLRLTTREFGREATNLVPAGPPLT